MSVLVALAGATGVAACSDSDSGAASDVTVVGTGEVRGTPDVLTANIGVEVSATSVAEVVEQINARANALVDALGGTGVEKKDIQTQQLSIQPEYSYPGTDGGVPVIAGYRATNSVKVVIRDLSKASEVLDKAVKAGGDSARLEGVAFSIEDDAELLKQARERAFNDAKARAEQYAELSGGSLGSVITITEAQTGASAPQPMMLKSDSMAADFAVEPGEQTVGFQVTVKWHMK